MTGVKFNNDPDGDDFDPILAHLIPNSVHGKVRFAFFQLHSPFADLFPPAEYTEVYRHVRWG
jgi:hypothetical protein